MNLTDTPAAHPALRALQLYAPELRAQTGTDIPRHGPSFGILRSEDAGTFVVVNHDGDTWPLEAETWGGAAREIRAIAIGARPPLGPPKRRKKAASPAAPAPAATASKKRSRA